MKKEEKISFKNRFFNTDVNKNLLILCSLALLSSLIIMLFAVSVLQNMLTNTYHVEKTRQERYYLWMEKVDEYPNSPDILYNAAVSSVNIGKKETAIRLLQKTLVLDPLFYDAKNLYDGLVKEAK